MTIADQLSALASIKAALRASINAKGGTLTEASPFAAYAPAIDALELGAGGGEVLTGVFLATSEGNDNGDPISAVSTDGVTWSPGAIGADALPAIAHGNERFVATNTSIGKETYDSADGVTWTTRSNVWPTADPRPCIAFGAGKFVAPARNLSAAFHSADGISWTAATLPRSAAWTAIVYGLGKFVAVASNANAAVYSADGISWSQATLPSSGFRSLACGDAAMVAVKPSSAAAARSIDGVTWTAVSLPWAGYDWSVAAGNGKFVVVARGDSSNSPTDAIAHSTDGLTWTAAALPAIGRWEVSFAGDKFFALMYADADDVATNVGAYSVDGVSWTPMTLPDLAYWRAVAFGPT